MILDTECFSMNSLISRRINASGVSKRYFASTFTSSVLPTPVEPAKINDTGFFLYEIPALLRFIAFATLETASSCPTMRFLISFSRRSIFWNSFSLMLVAGIPVHTSTTFARLNSSR